MYAQAAEYLAATGHATMRFLVLEPGENAHDDGGDGGEVANQKQQDWRRPTPMLSLRVPACLCHP